MKVDIEELCKVANERLKQMSQSNLDGRYTSELSVSRVRDYISKKLLDKPLKEGIKAYYTEHHLEQLLSLRQLQNDGLSDKYLKKISDTTTVSNDKQLQDEAMSLIANITNTTTNTNLFGSSNTSLTRKSLLQNVYDNSVKENTIDVSGYNISRTWQEFQLDKEGKVILKIEQGSTIKEKEVIMQKIKSILFPGENI